MASVSTQSNALLLSERCGDANPVFAARGLVDELHLMILATVLGRARPSSTAGRQAN
jgi:hypothetical protein